MSLHPNGHLSNLDSFKQRCFCNMSLYPNMTTNVVEYPIWNTLIPFRLELLDDIDNSDANENQENDDDEDDDLSPVPTESEEAGYTC